MSSTKHTTLVDLQQFNSYLSVFENSPIGICLASTDAVIVKANQRFCEMLEYKEEEVVGTAIGSFDHPDDLRKSKAFVKRLLNGSNHWLTTEKRYRKKSGAYLWAKTSATIIQDQVGRPALIVGMIEDISAMKEIQSALKDREERLSEAIVNTGVRITLLDLDGYVLYANQTLPEVPKEEFIGSCAYEWWPEALRGEIKGAMKIVRDTKKSLNFESQYPTPSGKLHYFFHDLSPRTHGGQVTGYTVICNDITERKKLEEDLERSHSLMELGLTAAKMGIWEWDVRENLLNWDHTACEIFGYEPDHLSGTVDEFISNLHDDDRERLLEENADAFKSKEAFNGEYRIVRQDKLEVRWVSFKSRYFRNTMNQVVRLTGVIWDSTEEKEKELIKQKAIELERQNKELQEFSYLASHDLQEPLRTVSNYVKLLSDKFEDVKDPHTPVFLDFISKAVNRMQHQIKDLLEYARLGHEKEPHSVDCNLLIQQVIENLEELIRTKQATIEIAPLPLISCYPQEITVLFQNLIHNGLKFQAPGTPATVRIEAKDEKNRWVFSVQDNGIGIEQEHFAKIFTIFQRLHPRNRFEGTGIGLAQCQKIVALHGGEIWLESKLDKGTTFFFSIPK